MKPIFIAYISLIYSFASAADMSFSSAFYTHGKVFSYSCMAVVKDNSHIESHSAIVVIEMKKESKIPRFYRDPDSSVRVQFSESEFTLANGSLIVFIDPASGTIQPISEGFTFNNRRDFFELHRRIEENVSNYLEK